MLGWKRRSSKIVSPEGRLVPIAGGQSTSYSGTQEVSDSTLYANQALRYTRSDLIYSAVNRVAEMAALQATKLRLYDPGSPRDPVTGWPTEEIEDSHPFLELWDRPNPWDSAFEFLEGSVITLSLNGNVYWHLDDGEEPVDQGEQFFIERKGEPAAMWLLRPDRVETKPDPKEYVKGYLYGTEGKKIMFAANAVQHFKRFHPLKDYEGLSPIEPANWASASDIAAQKSNWAVFKNGLKLSGIVESDAGDVSPDQVRAMREYIKDVYQEDPAKGHQVAFLWNSFKYRDLGMNMRDIEFIEGSKLNRNRILSIYGVHPSLMVSEDVNRANAQVGEYMTLKYTVAPMLERFASDITMLINSVWESDTPVEAHFANVVPLDDTMESEVALNNTLAAGRLIQALGPDEGVAEAQRRGLLSEEVDAAAVPLPGAPGVPFGVTDFGDRNTN